ncbi:MAG: 3-hydroxyacyl-CoA dehydrogenase [Rhodospirillales bacterium]|nr:3-hydroxyacyl-CoA dehydrogenase [Rhodospirillales bacterium]
MLDVARPDLTLGVVGAGVMGRGIAQIAAAAGIAVRLVDARPGAASAAKDSIGETFTRLAEKGRMTGEAARTATSRLTVAGDLADLAGCHIVIEAIVEDLPPKQELFTALEPIVGGDCLLATNTSSLSVAAIAAACRRPGRVGGFHFFNPVPLMKVVEVIDSVRSEPWVAETLVALAKRLGHFPARAKDTPGFLVNHAGRGFGTEALRILQEGIAAFDEIDRIARDVAGFRMGPFELLDLTGLDVSHPVMESIYNQFYQEPRFRPSPITHQRFVAGLLGRKTGQGFYGYSGDKQVVPPAPPVPKVDIPPVWISRDEPEWRRVLADLVKALGAALDDGEKPQPASLCLVTPLGDDATTTALAQGLDASRIIAVDMLFGLKARRTIMTTPVTDPQMRDAAWALLAGDGVPVSAIHDSPGFVAPRIVAHIVNVGCDISQQRIATPQDLDRAVTLGLGYPHGPLAFGDAIGPARILRLLEALHTFYKDPRYRPSPWLARRARLGVSLLTPEG